MDLLRSLILLHRLHGGFDFLLCQLDDLWLIDAVRKELVSLLPLANLGSGRKVFHLRLGCEDNLVVLRKEFIEVINNSLSVRILIRKVMTGLGPDFHEVLLVLCAVRAEWEGGI